MNTTVRTCLFLALLLTAVLLCAAPPTDTPVPQPRIVPLVPLAKDFEVIFGDPEKPGEPFVMRIRELPGTIIPPHTHPVDEHLTVLQGTIYIGIGEEFDRTKLKEMTAGSYAYLPKGTMIFGEAPEAATVQVHGVGPFHLHWKHPVKTFESSDAADVFKFRAGENVRTKRGSGRIEKGWASGAIVQYEVRTSRSGLIMASEHELRRK